jgi:hypothetical protein
MKKFVAFIAVVLFAGSVLSSCKSHQKCPAYSKNSTVEAPSRG